jgi:cytochrome P450
MENSVKKQVPGPPWYSALYKMAKMGSNPLKSVARDFQEFGDIFRIEFGRIKMYLVGHPDYASHILVKNNQNYSRMSALKSFFGESVVTTVGKVWQGQRHMLQPEFNHQKVDTYANTMASTTEGFLSEWHQRLRKDPIIDVASEMGNLTLRIAANALFSVDSRTFPESFHEAAVFLNRFADQETRKIFKIPMPFPTRSDQRFQKALGVMHEVVYKIIQDHRTRNDLNDVVSMMIHAKNPETGQPLTDQEIRDQAFTLLITGHETSANALSWTLFLLSRHPEIAQAVQNEIDAVLGQKTPTLFDIQKLPYLKRALQESMRLYPPVWAVARHIESDDVIDGYVLSQHAYLMVSIYSLHRHPEFWKEPDRFNPDRFLPQNAEKQHKYAYLPWGAGPHMCIGREFAMLEMLIVLAMLFQKYRFELVPGHPVEPEAIITLRPKFGIQMKLYERN